MFISPVVAADSSGRCVVIRLSKHQLAGNTADFWIGKIADKFLDRSGGYFRPDVNEEDYIRRCPIDSGIDCDCFSGLLFKDYGSDTRMISGIFG